MRAPARRQRLQRPNHRRHHRIKQLIVHHATYRVGSVNHATFDSYIQCSHWFEFEFEKRLVRPMQTAEFEFDNVCLFHVSAELNLETDSSITLIND